MNKYAKILVLLCIFGIIIFVVFQRKKPTENTTSLNNPFDSAETNKEKAPSFIEQLRQRNYQGGEIKIEETLSQNNSYTSYLISYPSDDLKIYGRMNVPAGQGPFPIIILNHGYFNQSSFTSGDGTQTMADILTRNGYITLASDYRGFGKSENDGQGSRGHNPNYAIDVLNLIASVKNLDRADPDKIGMWGHSMGGEVALRTVEVTDKIKALVLWAPTSRQSFRQRSFLRRGKKTATIRRFRWGFTHQLFTVHFLTD